ncbi:hypothetical protein CISG_10365 [Coccidioides immitis RMSCC 3703]|uniref:DUF7881 domain-containing protein n=1 Tax=Coccidioides immitis RMSCC 3703 TaxID=454286 RepID=A0A0J8QT00_COCIT|nr:hypothetical protein CISG_10365 [Coccidioides immitis RMSCC 3703]
MPIDRASWRNVWLYEASTGNLLGGTHQNGSMTEANLLSILEGVLLVVDDQWSVKHRNSALAIGSMNAPLSAGRVRNLLPKLYSREQRTMGRSTH